MRFIRLLNPLAMLLIALFGHQAHAWPQCNAQNQELFFTILGSDQFIVTVYDDEGVEVHSSGLIASNTNVPDFQECDWVAETNNTGHIPSTISAILGPDTLYTLIFENQKDMTRYTYSYAVCGNSTSPQRLANEYGFACPYGDLSSFGLNQDTWIYWADGEMHVSPIFLSAGVDEDVSQYFPGQEDLWILPYSTEAICVIRGCNGVIQSWDVFISPQADDPSPGNPPDPFSMSWTFPSHDVKVRTDVDGTDNTWRWYFSGQFVRFQPGYRLLSQGDLEAKDVTLTAANPSLGWGGVKVTGEGTLDFDGVVVEKADVGVEVRSTGNLFYETNFYQNGIGILSDYVSEGLDPVRSSFTLQRSCITESDFNFPLGLAGHGIWARNTDATIIRSSVEANEGFGLYVDNADVELRTLKLTGNGLTSTSSPDGAHILANGDLILTDFTDGLGYNRIRDNTTDEIEVRDNGYLTVGLFGANSNSLYKSGGLGGNFLIRNISASDQIKARQTYWGTGGAPPAGAFLNPAQVNATNPLATDPSAGAGSPIPCILSQAFGPGAGTTPEESSGFGDEDDRTILPETAAWMRSRIQSLRLGLTNPASDSAAALVQELYALQRIDRRDLLGEQPATRGLLAALRARLGSNPNVREAAEAALVAEVHDALRDGHYVQARILLRVFGPRAQGEGTLRTLALAEVSLAEQAEDYQDAIARIDVIVAGLGQEDEALAQSLADTRALLAARIVETGGAAPAPSENMLRTEDDSANAVSSEGGVERPALLAAYPNPFNPQTIVPFVLDASGTVRLAVYDMLGREVAVLADGSYEAGSHTALFDGAGLPSGAYLIRMTAENEGGVRTFTQRITLLR